MSQQRTDQIRQIVEQTIADAKIRSQAADGDNFGYNNGFYLQTSDKNFKAVLNGFIQPRYEYVFNRRPDSNSSAPPLSTTRDQDNASRTQRETARRAGQVDSATRQE